MYTGRPENLRQRQAKAAEMAGQIARILTAIDDLGVGPTAAANGRITGPGFELRRINDRWTVRA
ncbi:hypothetical protein [Streptomyces sp. NPDC017673]|uniref:hypothetical protein n=1 Tax=unclassified Streptomyces TaxID=2593676 RepID=UPI003789E920